MDPVPFIKMHGLGNDFVVIDGRADLPALSQDRARAICDRRTGVGCDQLLVIEPAANGDADAFLRIYNPDGGEAEACGNGTRCIAALLMDEGRTDAVRLETLRGILPAQRRDGGLVSVDMGKARLAWHEIPLQREMDTLHMDIEAPPLRDAVGVNMGNPHAVFFTDDAEAVPLAQIGPGLEHDPLFPERANIGIVQVLGPDRLRFRVWERGAGITRACGSGACAALVAAVRREAIAGRRATVVLDGGELAVEWREDGHVIMAGPVAESFRGAIDPDLLT